ncbi:methylenetetrahydrofolate reductase [Flavobacterium palustre]|uniref:Methylenetetrahydrofolate reductase n=1 Tax=Flavobacterium palustre TaxID=1476463 RepID=A0ABQ1H8A5_9FLAO|nr:methylenetetrahydrofolate reductase [NAD(P)H] [Flavobacterium palustre]GGA64521.1 methylenetetrahydrofolate reductase [Flavobacterium palustre]
MKVTQHLEAAKGKPLFSFEIVPPQKGSNIKDLYANIDPLMEFKPPFIDVTTSREEYVYIEKDGLFDRRITRMRPGTVGICASIQHKYGVDAIPHVLCGGFTREETEYLLVDCHYLGIENLVALRGDPMKGEKYFEPTVGGNAYAVDLVKQIKAMNNGKFLHGELPIQNAPDFCVGVAGYPEKHIEAPSLEADLKRLKEKVDAGADYIVTQMFFDNQRYFKFVEAARAIGITVPIIPGIKPVAVKRHLQLLPQVFWLDMPEELISAIENAKDNAAVRQIGVEFAVQQSKELMEFGVPCLHYYSMGKSDNIYQIASQVF